MRLVSFVLDGRAALGAAKEGGIANLLPRFAGQGIRTLRGLLAAGQLDAAARIAAAATPGLALDGTEFLPVIPDPDQIICIGNSRRVLALGADNMALEVMPFASPRRAFPVHRHLLAEAGIHIIENLRLHGICAAGVRSGVFMLFPVHFVGGTASPATSVVIT